MKEITLKHFFAGTLDALELQGELEKSLLPDAETTFHYQFMDMDSVHELSRDDLLKLTEAVLAGSLVALLLQPIAEVLIHSDQFEWLDDEIITEVCYGWLEPEENDALTMENLVLARQWLLGESQPTPLKS